MEFGNADNMALAEELDRIAAASEDDECLGAALLEAGCYYWPGDNKSYATWLHEVAARIRRKVANLTLPKLRRHSGKA